MSKATLYIDCQIFQTDAFDRGMGKYSLSLLTAFFKKNDKKYEAVLILNKNLPFDSKRKVLITTAVPQYSVLSVDLPTELVNDTDNKYAAAEAELTKIVKANYKDESGAVYLILAPFFVSFAAVFPNVVSIKKIALVYDIIPQLIWHKQHIFPDALYYRHFNIFTDAHYLVTISDSVNSDLVNIVGGAKEKILTIDGGPFESEISSKNPYAYKYILYPSAPIVHKNNVNAVEGFKIFNKNHNYAYKLLFTSNFDEDTRAQLKQKSPDIVFTGNVSDSELARLYQDSTVVLFASLSEGLGMPVLESVQHNKPVACSDIPVLNEISKDAFYFFDPTSPQDIGKALTEAVQQKNWNQKHQQYKNIKSKYTWSRSAEILETVFEKSVDENLDKQSLQIITPDPRHDSAVSKLVEALYMQLAENYSISTVLTKSKGASTPSFVPYMPQSGGEGVRLYIDASYKKPKNYGPNDIHVVLNTGKRKRISPFNKHRADIVLSAQRITTNSSLQLHKWEYDVAQTGTGSFSKLKTDNMKVIQRILK